jgi:hypothetical protein
MTQAQSYFESIVKPALHPCTDDEVVCPVCGSTAIGCRFVRIPDSDSVLEEHWCTPCMRMVWDTEHAGAAEVLHRHA